MKKKHEQGKFRVSFWLALSLFLVDCVQSTSVPGSKLIRATDIIYNNPNIINGFKSTEPAALVTTLLLIIILIDCCCGCCLNDHRRVL